MTDTGWLWAVFTVIAAATQTIRNAAQRELTAKLGTVGATQVRFLFGLPFALVFLAIVMMWARRGIPDIPPVFWLWAAVGSFGQVAATALMLMAMGERSFVVTIAYVKTEPLQVALLGLILLGDKLTPPLVVAILVATAGVFLMSVKPGALTGGLRPALLGMASGAFFGLSAIGFRGAILSLQEPDFVLAATFTVVCGLTIQTLVLLPYLWLRQRDVLRAIVAAWKPSLFAGFAGAVASQFWYLAFALTAAANVRTLALIEVIFAQAISKFVFKQKTTARELVGMTLIVVGVIVLMRSTG